MKKLLFTLCLLGFVGISAFAQKNVVFKLEGIVVNAKNECVEGVGVYDSQNLLLSITDANGIFRVDLKSAATLVFSHVGYDRKAVQMDPKQLQADEKGVYRTVVTLKGKVENIQEVTVTANMPQLAYDNEIVWVIDYLVGSDGIYAITSTGTKSNLLHLSFEQDTISQCPLARKYEELYRDVFGNVQVLSADSIYQVYCDGKDLHLLYGNSIDRYNKVLKPIVAATDSVIVQQNFMMLDQYLVYVVANKNTKKQEILQTIESDRFEMLKNWNVDNSRLSNATKESDFDTWIDISEMSLSRLEDEIVAEQQAIRSGKIYANSEERGSVPFFEYGEVMDPITQEEKTKNSDYRHDPRMRVMLPAVYSPIVSINNRLYLFDFENDNLSVYNNLGEFMSKSVIAFHKKTGYAKNLKTNNPWDKNVIVDAAKGKCYGQFITDGKVTLKEINLKNGNVGEAYKLDQHYFPTKIQVYDGYAYYLFLDSRKQNGDRRSLYRVKIN